MRASKKRKQKNNASPFPKGRNAVAHPLATEDNDKRAFTNASGKKSECRKTTRPPFPKGRNAVAHPLAPEGNNKRAFTNASGFMTKLKKMS